MSARGANVRAAAAEAVDAVVEGGRSLDVALRDLEADVAADDRPLLRNLAFGTVRNHYRLAEWQRQLMARRPKRRDRIIEALLRVGFYQLIDTRIPDHAAVSQTVEAARRLGRKSYAGLVNAILRRFIRDGIADTPPGSDEARVNHPAWLIEMLEADWPDDAERIFAANNERAPMWLRVNTRKLGVPAYLERLRAAGIAFAILPGLPEAVRLDEPMPVSSLPGFDEGLVSVQDGAAQVAAGWLLGDGAGRVLDACAAPGGKTAHLLELGGDTIHLDAIDIDAARLESVEQNLERLSLEAHLVAASAADLDTWWDGAPYDRILLDAPCSATGVIRRHPDIKLLRRASDIEALTGVQAELLERLWQVLAPGGRLLYVTCSVLARENEAIVDAFLAAHPDAEPEKLLPNNNIRDLMHARGPGYQLVPGTSGLDGFYFAAIEKQRQ